MSAIRTLLAESIDYAGLFPPAGLDMPDAVRNYAEYRESPEAWALGKFVVPVSRLGEFEAETAASLQRARLQAPWQLSVLASTDLCSDIPIVARFNQRHPGAMTADSLEVKASSARAIQDTMSQVPQDLPAFFEIPINRDPRELLAVIAHHGGRAKVRTGGVTGDAFPVTTDLLRFIRGCVQAGVPFKATAGLHHPVRAEYPLTYAAAGPCGTMFGFLNLFLATAFLQVGAEEAIAAQVLEERSPDAFQLDGESISWRNNRLDGQALALLRRKGMTSFGSCSFTEPLSDLEALHLLPPRPQPA